MPDFTNKIVNALRGTKGAQGGTSKEAKAAAAKRKKKRESEEREAEFQKRLKAAKLNEKKK